MYIHPRRPTDCVSSNTAERSAINNSKCFLLPVANTDQFENSQFLVAWIHLNDQHVGTETFQEFCLCAVGSLYTQYTRATLLSHHDCCHHWLLRRTNPDPDAEMKPFAGILHIVMSCSGSETLVWPRQPT